MSRFTCDEARRCVEACRAGSLGGDEAEALAVHLAICEPCRAEIELFEGVERALQGAPLPPLSDELEGRFLSGQPASRHRSMAWLPIAVAAAAALALLVLRPAPEPAVQAGPSVLPPPAVVAAPPVQPSPSPVVPDAPRVLPGVVDGTALWLVGDEPVQVVRNDADVAHFRLEQGRVVGVVGPNAPGFRFRVETPDLWVTAHGTVFSVTAEAGAPTRVRVAEGSVDVRRKDGGEDVTLPAGRAMTSSDPGPVRAEPSALLDDLATAGIEPPAPSGTLAILDGAVARPALRLEVPAEVAEEPRVEPEPPVAVAELRGLDELYRLAREHQSARQYREAQAVHEEIIRSHGDDRSAWYSHVALGQLELRARRAEASLAHFARYLELAPAGTLAEEARFGQVKALRGLARPDALVEQAGAYLSHHPDGSARAAVLQSRAEALASQGRPAEAATDYREILDRWPESQAAADAREALDAQPGGPGSGP